MNDLYYTAYGKDLADLFKTQAELLDEQGLEFDDIDYDVGYSVDADAYIPDIKDVFAASKHPDDQLPYDTGYYVDGVDARFLFMRKEWHGFQSRPVSYTAKCEGCLEGEDAAHTTLLGEAVSFESQTVADEEAFTLAKAQAEDKLCCNYVNSVQFHIAYCDDGMMGAPSVGRVDEGLFKYDGDPYTGHFDFDIFIGQMISDDDREYFYDKMLGDDDDMEAGWDHVNTLKDNMTEEDNQEYIDLIAEREAIRSAEAKLDCSFYNDEIYASRMCDEALLSFEYDIVINSEAGTRREIYWYGGANMEAGDYIIVYVQGGVKREDGSWSAGGNLAIQYSEYTTADVSSLRSEVSLEDLKDQYQGIILGSYRHAGGPIGMAWDRSVLHTGGYIHTPPTFRLVKSPESTGGYYDKPTILQEGGPFSLTAAEGQFTSKISKDIANTEAQEWAYTTAVEHLRCRPVFYNDAQTAQTCCPLSSYFDQSYTTVTVEAGAMSEASTQALINIKAKNYARLSARTLALTDTCLPKDNLVSENKFYVIVLTNTFTNAQLKTIRDYYSNIVQGNLIDYYDGQTLHRNANVHYVESSSRRYIQYMAARDIDIVGDTFIQLFVGDIGSAYFSADVGPSNLTGDAESIDITYLQNTYDAIRALGHKFHVNVLNTTEVGYDPDSPINTYALPWINTSAHLELLRQHPTLASNSQYSTISANHAGPPISAICDGNTPGDENQCGNAYWELFREALDASYKVGLNSRSYNHTTQEYGDFIGMRSGTSIIRPAWEDDVVVHDCGVGVDIKVEYEETRDGQVDIVSAESEMTDRDNYIEVGDAEYISPEGSEAVTDITDTSSVLFNPAEIILYTNKQNDLKSGSVVTDFISPAYSTYKTFYTLTNTSDFSITIQESSTSSEEFSFWANSAPSGVIKPGRSVTFWPSLEFKGIEGSYTTTYTIAYSVKDGSTTSQHNFRVTLTVDVR